MNDERAVDISGARIALYCEVFESPIRPANTIRYVFLDPSQSTPLSGRPATAPDYSWIHAPAVDDHGPPRHRRGVTDSPGLYFLGMHNQCSRGSSLIHWVKEDAAHITHRV
jgi:hypothetical protein